MKIIQLLVFFFLFIVDFAYCQEITKVVIEQLNLTNSKSIMYVITKEKILVYKKTNMKYRKVESNKMSSTIANEINDSVMKLFNKMKTKNTVFVNTNVLDGFNWKIKIEMNNICNTLSVTNCYLEDLDVIINVLNYNFKMKYYIYPTGYLFKSTHCSENY